MQSSKFIEFRNVTMQFKSGSGGVATVLDNLSFSIDRNSFTIIFGPSGSGKSTILNILLGLLPPTSGTVLVNGVDIYSLNNNERALFRAEHFGVISQNNNWVQSLSAQENVALPLLLSGSTYSEAIKEATESIRKVGMEEFSSYHPSVLSVGQQQRMSVARAIIEAPMLLVGDEPTGSLDSKNGDLIMKIITQYKNKSNSTIILVTHNVDYLTLSDNRIFLRDGVIEQYSGGYFVRSQEGKRVAQGTIGGRQQ